MEITALIYVTCHELGVYNEGGYYQLKKCSENSFIWEQQIILGKVKPIFKDVSVYLNKSVNHDYYICCLCPFEEADLWKFMPI